MAVIKVSSHQRASPGYTPSQAAGDALASLITIVGKEFPPGFLDIAAHIKFTAPLGDDTYFPSPHKEQEAVASIKALEGLAVSALANLRQQRRARRNIEVDMCKIACFLMSSYLCTINGMDKAHPKVRWKIPDTDLNRAQSILYRRLSANLYQTKIPTEYYHIHGSLEASKTLCMIGLPPFNPDLQGYQDCIETIEAAVRRFTTRELEELNDQEGQSGFPVLQPEQFLKTPHGEALRSLPPLTIQPLELKTPPAPFATLDETGTSTTTTYPQCLQGIRVLELCRVIAGPTIGRSLAAHGASVLKVTSPRLPDVPFFQVDVNTGKHATSLDLHSTADRAIFDSLLATADVVIDGYRPGALDRLGYGSEYLAELATIRGKGFVYVAEDCFGGTGTSEAYRAEWASRPGWQQIADCATGVAWEQGRFMGLDEPVVPPFPMSDYGTGAVGCVAAMIGLFRRATEGGSWAGRTSLCQYDMFLLSLGSHLPETQARLRKTHDAAFFDLRHHDSVDEVGKRALQSIKRLHPALFDEAMMHRAWSKGFQAEVRWPREPLRVSDVRIGHVRATRPNGFDPPTWVEWEEQDDMLETDEWL